MKITTLLCDQHRILREKLAQLDTLISRGADTDIAEVKRLLLDILPFLAEHEVVEEKILYPAAKDLGTTPEAFTGELREKHLTLHKLVASMRESLNAQDAAASHLDTVKEFSKFTLEHMRQEELVLFPLVDERFSEQEQEALTAQARELIKLLGGVTA